MTRFNITLQEGVDFVLNCFDKMWGGELFVPKIPSFKVTDVAKAIAPEAKHEKVGIRTGEKLHEEMITVSDAMNTVEFGDYFVITPNSAYLSWDRKKFLNESNQTVGEYCAEDFSYNSGTNPHFLTVEEIRNLIIKHVPGGEAICA
jgi:FlaA1/EpsC-like NDP-sugar epimerase